MDLEENRYIEWHTSNDATGRVRDFFWGHPSFVQLLRAFPKVLIMDSTYKTNRYWLRLLEIFGVTSTQLTFSVAFVYLESEKVQEYTWALEKLKSLMDRCMLPCVVIVTDRELADEY
ncbi:hypothetical protein MRB53_006219 [Persea americana]|uniref:Uncharacterized protein n=1 Tax=Persea americana TaxID=3435 RepID=A0ACC2MFB6_PERAE|nr:hypothetical protein MRB53_006219 [Persea americana]